MTTIAYKDGVMAADTLALDPNGLKDYASKIFRVRIGPDIFLFGSAGETSIAWALRDSVSGLAALTQLENQVIECDPEDKNSAMLCCGDEIYTKVGKRWKKMKLRNYHALGSGRDYALAAMFLGQSAEQAVNVAIEFDGWSGGEVEVLL